MNGVSTKLKNLKLINSMLLLLLVLYKVKRLYFKKIENFCLLSKNQILKVLAWMFFMYDVFELVKKKLFVINAIS